MRARGARYGLHYLFGLLMGSADVIPGVSGGTVALIVGIYERLIASIGRGVRSGVSLARADLPAAHAEFRAVDWMLVVPLVAGIATAFIAGSAVIPPLLDEYPAQMRGLFFGLIAGSIVIPWRRICRHTLLTGAAVLVAAAVAFVLTGLPEVADVSDPPLWRVLGSAMIAISAMILPGVSGSFLLLTMGMYEPTLDAVHERNLVYLGVFLVGAVIGLGVFSLLLRWLFAHAHDLTMAVLVGLMAGSLRALWPWQDDDRALRLPSEGDPVVLVLVLAVAGIAVVLLLAQFGDRLAAAEATAESEAEATDAAAERDVAS